ncbi:thiol:disulfide interchange protein DsbA/DsbL [Propionivibrio dicarboxylicus]|uniref:Thiol:disulfide interchange protein n=1 Tax=Propionivibrio dicarboxylicus TaxID=83767 RepID=A0A1G7WBW2_9RHOO|nr:thiol:disulfide interchange protein DsbA/DsbL [Propionivibrio dicarboxylicus]SDG69384.1 thiol:disulfide interchange protein DsbA [Propionivibrio dicarboxylicus]
MKHLVQGWLAALALALFAFALPAQAQLAVGRDYVVITPPLTSDTPAKIEVIEFFSYACPHCKDLHPYFDRWSTKLPSDVVVRRIPVGFNQPYYQLMGRFYYALEALGELSRLDSAVFSAIHDKGLKLVDEKSLTEWVVAQGVDAKKFYDAFNAFGVVSKAKRADQIAQAAHISGVPALVVDGTYLVTGNEIKTLPDLLVLTDKVIDKRRLERSSKKK